MNLKRVVKQLITASATLFILSAAPCAQAAIFTVDRTDNAAISACSAASNDCSLRGAVTKANATAGADTINFAATVFTAPGPHVISLATGLPHLTGTVTITGPGANVLTAKEGDAYQAFTLLTVDSGVSAIVSGLTLSNGSEGIVNNGTLTAIKCTFSNNAYQGIVNNGTLTATHCTLSANNANGILNDYGTLTAINCTFSGNYDGIVNGSAGTVTVTGCTLRGNSDSGIANSGTTTVSNCTFSGNGDGILNDGGALTATNCTFSGNSYSGISNYDFNEVGTVTAINCTLSSSNTGIYNGSGTLTLKNTLVAGNTTNAKGAFTNGGHNIISGTAAQAGLDPAGLKDNGGPTKTIALLPGSPAIDAGNSTLTTDQRGFSRPAGSAPDIGAFEFFIPAVAVNNPRSLPEGSASAPGSITFDITLSGASTQSVTVSYQTRDGINNPATAGLDYVEKHGKLTFAPGEVLKRVTIFFIGDSVAEAKETFFLDLTTLTNAVIADSRGVGTIVNDDATPNVFEDDEPSQ